MTMRMTFQMIQKRMISLLYCLAPPIRQRFANRLMMAATNAGPVKGIIQTVRRFLKRFIFRFQL